MISLIIAIVFDIILSFIILCIEILWIRRLYYFIKGLIAYVIYSYLIFNMKVNNFSDNKVFEGLYMLFMFLFALYVLYLDSSILVCFIIGVLNCAVPVMLGYLSDDYINYLPKCLQVIVLLFIGYIVNRNSDNVCRKLFIEKN
jgi:hypothetical protein